jgi:hypothetical protein
MIGATLGHYRNTDKIGGGGLAEHRWSHSSQVLHHWPSGDLTFLRYIVKWS